jgi:hypothetical protein
MARQDLNNGPKRGKGRHPENGRQLANGRGSGRNGVTEEDLGSWLDAYGRAWEERDPLAAASLFTEDASYQITPSPFGGPLLGRRAILDYWASATDQDKEVSFGFEVLAVADRRGIARWWASVREREDDDRLGGIFVVSLTSDNRCSELREWWNSEAPPVTSPTGARANGRPARRAH